MKEIKVVINPNGKSYLITKDGVVELGYVVSIDEITDEIEKALELD